MEYICNRDKKYHKMGFELTGAWFGLHFLLPFKSACNSFSVFKQFKFFFSLFKVLYYISISQQQGLKNIFSAYFSPAGLFLFLLLCSLWQNHQKLKGSGGYSLCYILPWHNSSKNSQKESDSMKEQIPTF